jgi:hypothetical protein
MLGSEAITANTFLAKRLRQVNNSRLSLHNLIFIFFSNC